jgi:hypothetical protein
MSRADVLNLTATLSNGMADPAMTSRYYSERCYELARENWFTNAYLIPLTRGQLEVDTRAAMGGLFVNLLGVVYDDVELEEISLREMEAIDPQWRDAMNRPRSYIVEDESSKVIALHPAPWVASNPNLGTYGEPFGLDYPTYNLAVFHSFAPLPPQSPFYYLELVIALRVIALEFQRESDHTDMEYSQAAQALSDLCKGILT